MLVRVCPDLYGKQSTAAGYAELPIDLSTAVVVGSALRAIARLLFRQGHSQSKFWGLTFRGGYLNLVVFSYSVFTFILG